MKVRAIKAKHITAVLRFRKQAQDLHTALRKILTKYKQYGLYSGICSELCWLPHEYGPYGFKELVFLFKSWPEYSGDELYPVPSYHEKLSAKEAYFNLPRWYTGEYAAARLRLLDYLIEQTK